MKDIAINAEVKKEIELAQARYHELCVANGVPMVACCVLGRTIHDNAVTGHKVLSCYINGETGATDSNILAALQILQLPRVPAFTVAALIELNEKSNGGCACQSNEVH